jgi:hypothetical protein
MFLGIHNEKSLKSSPVTDGSLDFLCTGSGSGSGSGTAALRFFTVLRLTGFAPLVGCDAGVGSLIDEPRIAEEKC